MSNTEQLQLFLPGTDDNIGVESSLADNFQKIDDKLGNGLKDETGFTYTSLGERLNTEQGQNRSARDDVADLKKKNPNVRMNDHFFHTAMHRGASFMAPENTLAAFAYAVDMGAWAIETDIQLTSDNKWVILHDTTIDRTSNSTGAVNSKTLATLKTYDFGSWYDPIYTGERIPTFEEYLNLCKLGNVVPYIEIKTNYNDAQIKSAVDIIKNFGMEDDAVFISFGLANLQKVRLESDYIALGYLSSNFSQVYLDDTKNLGNAFLDVDKAQVTQTNMDLARAAGVQVEAWTVDYNRDLRDLAKLGVRGVTTNRIPYHRGY